MVSSVTTLLDVSMNAPEPPAGPSDPNRAEQARAEQVGAEQVRYVDRREIFAQHAFFRGLAAHAIDELVARSRIERCRRGKTIFRRASPGTAMMAVLRGNVKICTVSRSGKEAVLNVIGPGQVFGEIAVLDGGPRTADAVALVDSDILVLDRRDFLPVMRAHPELAQRLLEVLCGRLRKTSEQLEDAFFLDMPGRLAKALLSAQTPGPNGTMQVMLTQREIGEMIGTARESVNKLLHTWERAGIVALRRGAIAVKRPQALKGLAEGETDEG
jgi:CRP/FNR family cyclic AMP-dependent transcriptional regulator